MTTHEQNLTMVASLIQNADAVDPTGGRTLPEWQEFNRTQGFTFDTIYPGNTPGSWSRVEGLQLAAADLERAYYRAQAALCGISEAEYRLCASEVEHYDQGRFQPPF